MGAASGPSGPGKGWLLIQHNQRGERSEHHCERQKVSKYALFQGKIRGISGSIIGLRRFNAQEHI